MGNVAIENPILGVLRRSALVLILLGLATQATREGIASWLGSKGSLEELHKGQEWDPSNPKLPVTTAELLSSSPDPDRAQAVDLLELATRRGPNRALHWALLGEADELAGNGSAAAAAFEQGLTLFPKSPKINWMYANFLIRAGDKQRSLVPLQLAIEGDLALRMGSFDLAWRAGLPAKQILEAIPDRPDILCEYLDYLVRSGRLDAAKDVWSRLTADPGAIDLGAPFRYFDALLYSRQIDAMTGVWSDLARRDPVQIPARAAGSNIVMNGGFEAPVLNGGFDWRLVPVDGAEILVDADVVHEGSRSLRITFDGKQNLDFAHVVQYVLVNPGTTYRFTAYARAKNITTDSGPRFAIYDPMDSKALSVATPSITGTFGWQELELQFTTGRETRIVVVQVMRPPSRKLDNQISGILWVDDVALVQVP